MELKDKLFNSFFYPFLISVILNTLVVTLFLGFFTNNYYDQRTLQNIINTEKKNSEMLLKSANVIMKNTFQKIQASLNEQIIYYQRKAKEILQVNNIKELNFSSYLKSAKGLHFLYCILYPEETNNTAIWVLNNHTTDVDINEHIEAKMQLLAYEKIIQNVDASYESTKPEATYYNFFFESNDLYIFYPLSSGCENGDFYLLNSYSYRYDTRQCIDENAEYYSVYRFKCKVYYHDFQTSKTDAFDYNYNPKRNKTILISNFYWAFTEYGDRKFTMCITFDDPISNDLGYACSDVICWNLVESLEELNSKMIGYFFITIVGFDHVFFFPKGTISPKTATANVFKWEFDFKLDEKIEFIENVRKIFTTNYIDYINDSNIYDEIYVNGKNSSGQYFYLRGEKIKYSIYPITFVNLHGEKEHVFSIIHIYNEEAFIEKINEYNNSLIVQIIVSLLIFIIFGTGILYIINLTFNFLAKYIVIPIKNVNYMLKGINIGGKFRLDYIDFLNKKRDENLEQLENIFLFESKMNKMKEKELNGEKEEDKLINNNNNKINPFTYSEFDKKYDEESSFIEQELSFYDFNEEYLEYRSIEMEGLIKSLMNLKGSINLTSSDGEINQIIDYCKSEDIFRNYKNKEGSIICQSNIGNLQSQLMEFDKAIYHLALSLQDNKLKRFLSRNLSDELDEGDVLFNQLFIFLNRRKDNDDNNILIEKQINSSKENFSKKYIGILINTRYVRLIHAYYMFFKNIQKLKKSDDKIIIDQFIHTSFHTISYYHKIIIQFIYLSYFKNDLIKIGESILNYLEFLIKFKFKISSDDEDVFKFDNKDNIEYLEKQEFKKNIFDKIINWFNLFDEYISFIKDNSSLNDAKVAIEEYFRSLNSENTEFNLESQSAFMFRINLQKNDFLKGKFSLYCQNYNDALFYFIRAAKKNRVIIDGLIKKRSLKHIYKILIIIKKKYENMGLKNMNIEKEIKYFKKNRSSIINKNRKSTLRGFNTGKVTFGKELEKVKNNIIKDINEFSEKKEKDIIILIDFNLYYNTQENNYQEDNLYTKTYKIDSFIEQAILILDNYLSKKDRFCAFIYSNDYQLVCPLSDVNKIDANSFFKDLLYYKNNSINEEDYELNVNNNEFYRNSTLNISDLKDLRLSIAENNNISITLDKNSSEISEKEDKNNDKITGLVNSMNYINYYSKKKSGLKNEIYFILFTDILNINFIDNEEVESIFEKLDENKQFIFLFVGKNKKMEIKSSSTNDSKVKKLEQIILNKFGKDSEIIYFENMLKIKTILSNNKVIKDEIFHPNEVYK